MFSSKTFIVAASLATVALAKTDLSGCTSTDVSSPAGASIAYYVPGTGELCEFLDCGGGRAPPKTTVPGCPSYEGTLTYSPSFLPGYGSATAAPSVTSSASAESTTDESVSSEPSISSKTVSEATIVSVSTIDSSMSATATATSTITSIAVAPGAANGTAIIINTSSGRTNGTVTAGSPSSSTASDSGAMETARVWAAGFMGLGALVIAL